MMKSVSEILNDFKLGYETRFRKMYSGLHNKKIYIYGSGVYGRNLKKALLDYNCVDEIDAFINDFENGFLIDGIPVKSFEELDFTDANYCILVAIENRNALIKKLQNAGVTFLSLSQKDFFCWCALIHDSYCKDGFHKIDDLGGRIEHYHKDLLLQKDLWKTFYDDRESLEVVSSRINFYETGDLSYLEDCKISSQDYFVHDLIEVKNDDVFVDCGAYDGDSAISFNKFAKNQYKKIICFEPDSVNFRKLQQVFHNVENVEMFPYAVGDENGTISFSEGKGNESAIAENGNVCVPIIRMDDFIKGPISIIKMDIEGAELDALRGGAELIKKYRPKLIVSAYHNVEDLYEIPMFIRSLVPEYKFKLRQKLPAIYDTVLYAEVE